MIKRIAIFVAGQQEEYARITTAEDTHPERVSLIRERMKGKPWSHYVAIFYPDGITPSTAFKVKSGTKWQDLASSAEIVDPVFFKPLIIGRFEYMMKNHYYPLILLFTAGIIVAAVLSFIEKNNGWLLSVLFLAVDVVIYFLGNRAYDKYRQVMIRQWKQVHRTTIK